MCLKVWKAWHPADTAKLNAATLLRKCSENLATTCRRDPDAFAPGSQQPPYILTQPIAADAQLSRLLFEQCVAAVGSDKAQQGLNATADSFYSSQVLLLAMVMSWQVWCCDSMSELWSAREF